jgi:Protein of unknown function (DUF2924)
MNSPVKLSDTARTILSAASRREDRCLIAPKNLKRPEGGLSKVTQRRLTSLANQLETDGRIAPLPGPRIKPGSRLVREWHSRTHTVCVTDEGFEFQGKTYRSLTQIAFDLTGAKWSGPRFFGLTQRPKSAARGETTAASKTDSEGGERDANNSDLESESSNG